MLRDAHTEKSRLMESRVSRGPERPPPAGVCAAPGAVSPHCSGDFREEDKTGPSSWGVGGLGDSHVFQGSQEKQGAARRVSRGGTPGLQVFPSGGLVATTGVWLPASPWRAILPGEGLEKQ